MDRRSKGKNNWDDFSEYDNRIWKYMERLNDKPVSQYAEMNPDKETQDLWKDLNRQQKVFRTFLAFNEDTDNGGVDQFVKD